MSRWEIRYGPRLRRGPIRRPLVFVIIWVALVIHITQALIMLYGRSANRAIDVAAILDWIPPELAPAVLISVSGLAIFGLLDLNFPWYARLAFLLPQQGLITLSVWGVILAVMKGAYADGTVKPGAHIFVDQIWLIGYFFIHAYSVSRRAGIGGAYES